ncbi:MAG TPA: sulfatase-like hydrolase/transferase [Polyangiaceae bacterium]|nr:sulfatase-like hydrolase/transferase [Polyangiaceae bacterium]
MTHWRGKLGLVSRLGAVPLVCSLALGVSFSLQSCASEPLDKAGDEKVGSLGLNLDVAPGVTLNSVTYSITGNGFSKTGTIDTSGAPTITGTIGGIPAGNGYTLTLNAKSAEGGTSFTGSATFNVTAGKTTSVTIHLKGTVTSGNGSVSVNGSLNVGPVIDEVTVTPLEVFVGSKVTLNGVASDADNAPAALSYYWSTSGGVISNPIAPSATLTSSAPGTFTVKLTVSDGEITTSQSTQVTFVARDAGGGEGGAGGQGGDGVKQPNVLLIIADDYGAEAASIYPELNGDSGAVPVPNVEALAQNGLVFDNAWASPACSMTRGTIVSGLYGYRTGVTSVGAVLPTDTVTLFDRISAESPDYSQGFFGKYHLGGGLFDPRAGGTFADSGKILQHVRDLGIPNFRGILGGALTDYFSWNIYDINGPAVPTTAYATSVLTDIAIEHIHEQEASRPGKPWFVYQAYNAPHAANGGNSPYQVPPPYLHSVDLRSVGSPAPGTSATNVPVYQANIQALDTEIGRLLKEVDFEKTTVIFIGDNGTPAEVKDKGAHIRGSKGSAYEGGVRVPFIVTGAGVTRRGREDDLVVTSDLYATILSLTGINVSHVNNSYSIKPLLSDETATSGRTHSFSETSSGTAQRRYALKDKRYKLVSNLGKRELYDLATDSQETSDLYANPAYAAVRATLEAEIDVLNADAKPGYFP